MATGTVNMATTARMVTKMATPPPVAMATGGGGGVKCGPHNAPLSRYKALKNEISITGNRNILP